MGIKLIVLTLTMMALETSFAQCQGRIINSNMVSSILQDILSPAKTQSAIQLIKMAATGANRQIPEIAMPNRLCNKPIERAMPVRSIMPSEMRPRAYVSKEIEPPRIMSRLEIMPIRNDMVPSRVMPTVHENVMPTVRVNPMPEMMTQQFMKQPIPMVEPYPMMNGMINYANPACPQTFLPRNPSLVSPYLPLASPVSAFAPPSSNMLPPPTQTRNQFLRKIPIPPPTL